MSWSAFLPENIAKHPGNFVGPNVAGAIVQGLETGILINQSARFWSRASDEPTIIKILVLFVSILALFQTSIAFYNTWRVVVLGFGDWSTVVFLQWPDRIQPALNAFMAAPFQAFLIWRCWNAMQRRFIILLPLASLLIAAVAMNIVITVKVFYFPLSIIGLPLLTAPPRLFVSAFVLTAVLDILITALSAFISDLISQNFRTPLLFFLGFLLLSIEVNLTYKTFKKTCYLLWFLSDARSQVVSRQFDKILGRLIRLLWESAFPPCACAIAGCVVYITMSLENLWDVFCQSILGKLYVISLFVILNGRADLKHTPSTLTPHDQSGTAGFHNYWASGAPPEVRVHLTTIVDRLSEEEMDLTPSTEQSRAASRVQSIDTNKSDEKAEKDFRTNTSADRGIDSEVEMDDVFNELPTAPFRTLTRGSRTHSSQ